MGGPIESAWYYLSPPAVEGVSQASVKTADEKLIIGSLMVVSNFHRLPPGKMPAYSSFHKSQSQHHPGVGCFFG